MLLASPTIVTRMNASGNWLETAAGHFFSAEIWIAAPIQSA
jgi:hypothetical protein